MNVSWKVRCINPLKKDHHPASKDLFSFPKTLRSSYPSVPENAKICSNCRRQIFKETESPSFASKKARVDCDNEYHRAGVIVLEQIKRKFSESICKEDRIQLLTLAPDF